MSEDQQQAAARGLTTEELTRFFSVLSHDLKSPIFSIDGFSELLLGDYSERLDEEGQDFLRRIRSSAKQMKRILDEMSHLVKLLARPTVRRPTPLRELVEEVLLKCNYLVDEGGVKVSVADDFPTVNIDPEKMREAISALLSNALEFNDRPKGGRTVSITSDETDGNVRLCVFDNGIGIDPRYLNQIFDLGLKLDKSRGGGPGYGLYVARRIAEDHGGTVTAHSNLGDGSTFCLTFEK